MTYIEKILRKEKCFDSLVRQSSFDKFSRTANRYISVYKKEPMLAVSETINACLLWASTVEGSEYWRDLYNKYRLMSSTDFKKLLPTTIKYNKDLK